VKAGGISAGLAISILVGVFLRYRLCTWLVEEIPRSFRVEQNIRVQRLEEHWSEAVGTMGSGYSGFWESGGSG
jgi:hypothetical protein